MKLRVDCNKRIFDKKDNVFVNQMTDEKDRYIISYGTGVYVRKTKTQITNDKEVVIKGKELELGRELTPQEKKMIKVDTDVEVFTGDILGDAYGCLYYIDYCEKCRSFEPFSLEGCLSCDNYVRFCEVDFPNFHIIGNKYQHEKLLTLNF